jgi:2-C-methyl-D-erythritol 4-phosphate cytidylyltransferase
MAHHVIIVAAGKGSRMGEALPKQFLELNGEPILLHTLRRFYTYDPSLHLIVVLHPDYVAFWNDLARTLRVDIPHRTVAGGAERFHSVRNGLQSIDDRDGIVAIHDGVRPLVSNATLQRCFEAAAQHGSAVPSLPVHESMRSVDAHGHNQAVDRSRYRLVQTPQCFQLNDLRSAFEQDYNDAFTDDASVWEHFGRAVHLVEGNQENLKITTPEDLKMAQALMAK